MTLIFLLPLALHYKVVRRAIAQVHRAPWPAHLRRPFAEIAAILRHQFSFLVNAADFEFLQVIEDKKVGPETRRDRAMIAQPVMSRGIDRAHLDRGDR